MKLKLKLLTIFCLWSFAVLAAVFIISDGSLLVKTLFASITIAIGLAITIFAYRIEKQIEVEKEHSDGL